MPTFTSVALDRLIEPKAIWLSEASSKDDVAHQQALANEKTVEIAKSLEAENVKSWKSVSVDENYVKFVLNGKRGNNDTSIDDADSEIDDFFDTQDSMSVNSSIEGDTDYVLEDLLSGSGPQLLANDIKAELCETRESLLMELDKRKQAEDLLNYMQSQWRKIREQLAIVGLNLPEDPALADDEAEELCGQIHVVRFVSNSIGRGIAKAELEAEMETQIESKNFEISRLMDRLRYYEAVNREMTQRNQENVETTRARQQRKRRQKWIWVSIAAAITLGSAVVAWSSVDPSPPHTSEVNR